MPPQDITLPCGGFWFYHYLQKLSNFGILTLSYF